MLPCQPIAALSHQLVTCSHHPAQSSAGALAMAVPLALTHGEDQKGWRRNQHLVDSLPYIDSLTPAEKRAVDQLIEEEVRCASGKAVHVPHKWLPLVGASASNRP